MVIYISIIGLKNKQKEQKMKNMKKKEWLFV